MTPHPYRENAYKEPKPMKPPFMLRTTKLRLAMHLSITVIVFLWFSAMAADIERRPFHLHHPYLLVGLGAFNVAFWSFIELIRDHKEPR